MRQRTWQATTNAASVRPYQPQDPHKWIHWPISAHRGELFVRQFDQDASGDVWLLLDLQTAVQLGSGADNTEEQAVLLAASLSARALRHNRAVGLSQLRPTTPNCAARSRDAANSGKFCAHWLFPKQMAQSV